MIFSKQQLWERFQKYYTEYPALGMSLDLSRMNLDEGLVTEMRRRFEKVFADMAALERGAIANPDENRMVGHYWLRNSALAPTPEIRSAIDRTIAEVRAFAKEVHSGAVRGEKGFFKNYLLIGIGGSALGPQFVANALGEPKKDKLRPFFFDNTDPDGMHRVLTSIPELGETLCLVISKSGGTKETRNGMIVAQTAYERAGLSFAKHAVGVTRDGSVLDRYCNDNGWLKRFPMWDWVGGRTSQMSAVGLLPAALQGFNIHGILAGARACDEVTRVLEFGKNPAAQLAAAWFRAGDGKGTKSMVVIPYKDRLELFSRYLQQLVMESLGKEKNLAGQIVNQGITVLGNKGSTDQHSYIQQLIDGLDNFFATFIDVLKDGEHAAIPVEEDINSGDFLNGFLLGTRHALTERGRDSITITIQEVSPFSVGVLIALFERTVGFYASLIGINAYNQPGVEAGKKAAESILDLQRRIMRYLESANEPSRLAEIAASVQRPDEIEHVFRICERLAANKHRGIERRLGSSWLESSYVKR